MLSRKHEIIILISIIALAFLLRLYRLTYPLADWHSFRQADTASVAREYVRSGIDLFHPRYHDLSNIQSGQDNPQGYRMVEFPLVSGAVAWSFLILKMVTAIELHVWYRFISILFSLGSMVVLYVLVRSLYGYRPALLTTAAFALIPYNIFYSRSILSEVPLVTVYLLALYAGWRLKAQPHWSWFLLMVVSAAVALLLKPMAVFMLVPLLVPALISIYTSTRRLFIWSLAATLIVLPLLCWRFWIAQYPEGIPSATWLLNGNGIRLRPAWFRWLFYERLTKLILGYGGLLLFFTGLYAVIKPLSAIPLKKWSRSLPAASALFVSAWIIGALAYLIVFATGNVQHDYYQVPLIPLVSLLVALGIDYLWSGRSRLAKGLVLIICCLSLFLSWQQVKGYFNVNDWAIVHAGAAIDRLTSPGSLVIAPYMGDTAFLYQTNRRGWPLGHDLDKKIAQGAQYYVTVNSDDEAREMEQRYTVLEKTPEYLIIQLTPRSTLSPSE